MADDRRQPADDGLAVHPTRYPLLDARYWLGRIERAQREKPGTVTEAFVVE